MFCINCSHSSTSVTNSRPSQGTALVWRRRLCLKCRTVFTTYERPSLTDIRYVMHADGSRDSFNLGKLIQSIGASFSHDKKSAQYDSMALAQTVEDILITSHDALTPPMISQATYRTLQRFDQLAAVQYAAKHHLIKSTRRRPGRPSITSQAAES